jgi:hypothetical protein
MRHRFFLVLFLIACARPAAPAHRFIAERTDPSGAGMDAERLSRIPVRMQAFVDHGKAAGIVTLLARHGRLALLSAVGYQDR